MTYKVITRDFSYREKHYCIVFDGKYYMTVDRKFIDGNGRTNKVLTFSDGLHTSLTLQGCIDDTKRDLDMEYYIAQGMSKAEAFAKIFGLDVELTAQLF